ncbi:hypothetical protein [Bacillus sp. UNC322MFChir4.1]|uniref:hypothetical protein n=1 Tax=Bacillus sp. UNC322MFChir4.1 TaxID=1449045 RepID=UPI000AF79E3E|nr:hypothetical protein [Bacillus sp. UNC322MFChir4.1]
MIKILVPIIVILAIVLQKKKAQNDEQGKSNNSIKAIARVMLVVGLALIVLAFYKVSQY